MRDGVVGGGKEREARYEREGERERNGVRERGR